MRAQRVPRLNNELFEMKNLVLVLSIRMYAHLLLSVLLSPLLVTSVLAQDAASLASQCHQLADREQRLACYDEATEYVPSAAEPTEITVQEELLGTQWRISQETSSLDDRTDVWLSVRSSNSEPNQIGRPERATLWVRCMRNSTNVFVAFNDYTSDNQSVRYRLDDGPLRSIWMVHMQGGEGIGIWSGGQAIPFIKQLFGHSEAVIGYASYSNQSLEFRFDISGLKSRIEPLATSCEWTP